MTDDMTGDENSELLPCPLCGHNEIRSAYRVPVRGGNSRLGIECSRCGCGVSAYNLGKGESLDVLEKRAVAKWNTRATPPVTGDELLPADEVFSDTVSRALNEKRKPSTKVFIEREELMQLVEIVTCQQILLHKRGLDMHPELDEFIQSIKRRLEADDG